MAASPLDSALYRELFDAADVKALFSDRAEVRAMLLVEAALAKAQGAAGMIPAEAADAIHAAARSVEIDPGDLALATGRNAVPVPALVTAFRAAMNAPDHARFVHWGATSQDIMDTALTLRLRRVVGIYRDRLRTCLRELGRLADSHADQPMAGRTYGQIATPTSFGAVVASWGGPLLGQLARLDAIEDALCHVSLSGAAGTLSVMGKDGPRIRAAMAEELGLGDLGTSWHATRDPVTGFAAWATITATALGKMGDDLVLMAQSGIDEVGFGTSGGSSTMPQKANPVAASTLGALARHVLGLNPTIQAAALHHQQRDAAAWLSEWLALPQLCISLGVALETATRMLPGLEPRPDRMSANLDDGSGLIHAEALTFALARFMPRPEAQEAISALVAEARGSGTPLLDLVARDHGAAAMPDLAPPASLGQAPADARAFATAVAGL